MELFQRKELLTSLFVFVWLVSALAGQAVQEPKAKTQRTVTLKFEMISPVLDDDTKVYITGSLPGLGNWNPAKVQMKNVGKHAWIYEIKCKPSFPVEYKYTLGSWKNEAANEKGRPRPNFVARSDTDKVIRDRIDSWTNGESHPVQGQITGTVKYHRQIKGSGILPRDVVVWLPPGYDESTDRYPVMYMNDGQNIVDPKTSSFGVDWQIDETCTQLIKADKIKPLIVVGIFNTSQRGKDYLPGPSGKNYQSFVFDTLKPLIDKTYRTKPDREHTVVAGSSAGGICAFTLAWDNPKVFGSAICMSPSFKYRQPSGDIAVDYLDKFKQSALPDPVPFFYLDNGGVGLEQLLQPGIDGMLAALKEKGLVEGKNYVWKSFPDARHDESAWAKRMPDVLIRVFGTGK